MTLPIIKTPKLVLCAMAFLGPIALNVYAPIMPSLKVAFSSSADSVQLGMTIFLLFFALSQLFCGLFVELFGQKKVLIAGIFLYILGSVIGILSGNIYWLILARALQATGGGFSLLLTRSIILDQNSPNKAAAKLSYIALGMATLQACLPTISGYLNVQFSWHVIFYLSLVIALIALWAVYYYLPAITLTQQDSKTPLLIKNIFKTYFDVLRFPSFFYFALTNALISAGFFVFVLNVPFIVADNLSGNSLDYGKWYLFVALGFWLGSLIASQISERIGNHIMLKFGLYLAPLAGFIMTILFVVYDVNYLSLFIPMALFTFSRGILLPNAQASAVTITPFNRSTSMGIFSFCQLIIGASIAQFSVIFIQQNILYLPVSIFFLSSVSLLTYYKAVKNIII